jgi:hypothetical protein
LGAPQEDGRALSADTDRQPPIAPPALVISGLVVTKAALLAALSQYVPHLHDINALDGDRYVLSVGDHHPGNNGASSDERL